MTFLYMLDTNMVSYITRGRSLAARTQLLTMKDDEVACVSAITEAEIRYGLAKRPEATTLRGLMEAFLSSIQILQWGRDEAQAYGALDMLIAAHAIAMGAVLVTNDQAFAQVDQLHATVNWATDL